MTTAGRGHIGGLRSRRMAAKRESTKLTTHGAIDPAKLYPLDLFKRLAGLEKAAMKTARDNGLVVLRLDQRENAPGFVLGQDFLEYLRRQSGVRTVPIRRGMTDSPSTRESA